MATNVATLLRNAIVAILTADTTLQSSTYCNRTTGIVVRWRTIATAIRPVFAYLMPANNITGGRGSRRRVQILMAAFAEGNGCQDKVEGMAQRARELLTPMAFQAQGVDAEVIDFTERDDGESGDTVTDRARYDFDILIRVTAPP